MGSEVHAVVAIRKAEAVHVDEAGSHAHAGSQEVLDGRKNYQHSQEHFRNCPKHPNLPLDSETARERNHLTIVHFFTQNLVFRLPRV